MLMTNDSIPTNNLSSKSPSTTQLSTPEPTPNLPNRFQPGKSGNPKGRPPGSKNAITQLRVAIEQSVREAVADDLVEIALKAVEMAKAGDKHMIKLMLELFVSKAPPVEDAEQGVQKISIAINKLEMNPAPRTISVIDAPFTEVDNK